MKIKSIKKIIFDKPQPFYDVINANPWNNFLVKTKDTYVVSHNCFFDEISFIPNQDVEKQKEKAKTLVNTAAARMQSRFMKGDVNPTILVLASSKRTEQSFMETWIENKKKQDSKTVRIIDEPQWVIRTDKNSSRTFKVAIGNKFLDSEIIPQGTPDEMLDLYRARGFTLIDVPIGYYENFLDDINVALTDIAGISTSSTNRFLSGQRIQSIKNKRLKNLMTKEIIQVGNSKDDTAQYYDFIDTNLIDSYITSRPLYIHLDMSLTGDKTGIAGVYIKGKKPHKEGIPDNKDLSYGLAFSFAVKAPKGYQVSFEKNRNFIRWLKNYGFKIKGISSDTFQSADLLQQLSAEGFKTEVISVDRVDTESKQCLAYQTLRSAIYEERLEIYDKCDLLTDEWLGLERNNNTGKIDHSPSGVNSKDISDAVCGALFNASKHAEEYAYEYGEDLQTTVEANVNHEQEFLNQLTVDFEQELMKIQDPLRPKMEQDGTVNPQSFYRDFGMGKATTKFQSPFVDDIIFI